MQNYRIKNTDELIQGIRSILSNHCCSFSEDEQVLLNNCIEKLEEMDKIQEFHAKMELFGSAIGMLSKVFIVADHLKNLF